MRQIGLLYRVEQEENEKLLIVLSIVCNSDFSENVFFLDEKNIYLGAGEYWNFFKKIKNLIKETGIFYVKSRSSKKVYANGYDNIDFNENNESNSAEEEMSFWVEKLLASQIKNKSKVLGIDINEEKIFTTHNGEKYIQLYFLKSVNYIFHWEYSTKARYTPVPGKRRYGVEKPLILDQEESNSILLDEESTLINYIERFLKKEHFIALEAKHEYKKRKKYKYGEAGYDDSEEAVMRSFDDDTSENFGF